MIKEAIGKVVSGGSLSEAEAQQAMGEIMEAQATPAQLGGFLVALRMKGETPEELLGFVRTMRAMAIRVDGGPDLLDTCGTGGDSSGTFNISTASALIAAAAGIKVAKHGNRSATSKCGSADVLEALGSKLSLTAAQAQECLDKVGFAFLFAQAYHPAMRHAGPVRGEIGIRTVFNILGPLSNPAGATRHLLGIADPSLAAKMAFVLQNLGVKHALIVHGQEGLDEISIAGPTSVHEIRGGATKTYTLTPKDFGLPVAGLKALAGGDKDENARIVRGLFSGEKGPKRDALLANAGAALYVGGKANSIGEGVGQAAVVIDSRAAMQTLESYVTLTQSFNP